MTNLARLGFEFDGSGAAQADQAFDKVATGARRVEGAVTGAEAATQRLGEAARGTAGPIVAMNDNIRAQQRALMLTRGAMGLTASEGLNMGRQLSDVGVSLALGMSPFMVAIQQGPQIFDVFQQSAIRASTSIRAAMVATGVAVWTALAPLLPIIGALAVAGGAVAAAWGLATRSISNDIGDVTKTMNLSEAQIERLKKANVDMTVTAGDVWRGLGTTIAQMFDETFGTQVDWISERWNSFLDDLTANTGKEVDMVAGFFTGAFYVVRNTWKLLPAALGDAAYSAANATVDALNWMLRKGVEGIDFLRREYNKLPEWMRGGETAPEIGAAYQIGTLSNPYAGSMDALDAGNASEYTRGYDSRRGMSGRIMNRVRQNTLGSAQGRLQGEAGEAGDAGRPDTSGAKQAEETLTALAEVNLNPLHVQVDRLNTPLGQMARELDHIDYLTRNVGDGLASAFGKGGSALGGMLSTMTSYRAQIGAWEAEIDDMRVKEAYNTERLAEIEAERGQAGMAVYGDLARAARGYFDEGSTGYQVLLAIEQVYRAQQLAGMLQAIITGNTETAASVANSGVKGSASMAAGAAKMFEVLGPWAFPAVAAMIGLLVGMGLKGGSGGGSAGRSGPAAANDNAMGLETASTVRTQAVRADHAQAAAASRSEVEVRVTADRDGLNAYVVGTASKVARPMVVQGMAAASGATRAQVMYDLDQRATYSRKSG